MMRRAAQTAAQPRPHAALLALPVLVAAALALLLSPPAEAGKKPRFKNRELPLNPNKLYDVSVADIDGDTDLDMFTTHHRYRGNLLTVQGGAFIARLDNSRLSATDHVPGFDDSYAKPAIVPAGLYIWVDADGNTHIVTKDLGKIVQVPLRRVTGSIRYRGRGFKVLRARGVRVGRRTDGSTNPASGILDFDAGPSSELVVRAQYMDLPFDVSVSPLFPRQRIFMGPRRSVPPSREVSFDLGDRHGVAWADFNQDRIVDAYIANGGNRGAINRLSEQSGDELYFGTGGGAFREDIEGARISKGYCRGRSAEPVDFDSDGDLDIFVGCETGAPLLLNQKRVVGRFGSSSLLMQKAGVRGDLYRWIDLDRDGDPELVAAHGTKVRVYERRGDGSFARAQSMRPKGMGKTLGGIAIGDPDGDLDPDVFIASRGGNSLLENRGGNLFPKQPEKVGLPRRDAVAFSFVDYDNDGRLDAHATPGGIYRQQGKKGRFKRTGALKLGNKAQWAASHWFDLEGDGDRDLVALIKRGDGVVVSRHLSENRTRDGHWLDVQLRGPVGNMQAIGARVVVTTRQGKQAGWVGQAEGSRHSMGLYDLYFGLGRASVARSIEVFWPDGRRSTLRNVRADRRLVIDASSAR